MQGVILRGHLLLDLVISHLLVAKAREKNASLKRTPFSRKIGLLKKHALVDEALISLIRKLASIRNAHVHDPQTQSTYRNVHRLWKQAREAGIEHRFHSSEEEMQISGQVEAIGELADRLFDPAHEMADFIVELICHMVFWNYDAFDLVKLTATLAHSNR